MGADTDRVRHLERRADAQEADRKHLATEAYVDKAFLKLVLWMVGLLVPVYLGVLGLYVVLFQLLS